MTDKEFDEMKFHAGMIIHFAGWECALHGVFFETRELKIMSPSFKRVWVKARFCSVKEEKK